MVRTTNRKKSVQEVKIQNEWEFKKKLCLAALEMLRKSDDPRAADAVKHYEAQLAEIELIRTGQKPAPVVVGLKAAQMFGETKV